MGKEDVVFIYNEILFSHEEEGNPAICKNMDRLESTVLNEISQTEKDKYCMASLIWAI